MKKSFVILASAVLLAGCSGIGSHLPKSAEYRTEDPAVDSMLQSIRLIWATSELNSIMVVKDGKKILEYYDCCYGPDFMNICWSASKTFTATAVGFAVQDGLLDVKGRLVDYLKPEQLPRDVSDTLAGLTLYDLLRMSSGLKTDPIGQTSCGKLKTPALTVLESGFENMPGEKYRYNSMNTYLLGVAVSNVTGMALEDYLNEKLFKPLDIRKYHWDKSAEGYNTGGWGLYLPTESLAKMGIFMLNRGVWNGKRLLNDEWFDEATKVQIRQYHGKGYSEERIAGLQDNDFNMGYGYQVWMNSVGGFRLDGAHGQFVMVLPEHNAVIVLTGNVGNTGPEMEAIWQYLLPLVEE